MGSGEVGYDSHSVISGNRHWIVQCQADRGVIILGKCSQMGVAVLVLGSRYSLHIHNLKETWLHAAEGCISPYEPQGGERVHGVEAEGWVGAEVCQNQQLRGWAFWMGTLVFWHGIRQSPVGMWAGILLMYISGDWCQSVCAVCVVHGVVCAAVAVVCEVCARATETAWCARCVVWRLVALSLDGLELLQWRKLFFLGSFVLYFRK